MELDSFYIKVVGYKQYAKTLATLKDVGIKFISDKVDNESYAVALHLKGVHPAYIYVNSVTRQGYVFYARGAIKHSVQVTLKQVKKNARKRMVS